MDPGDARTADCIRPDGYGDSFGCMYFFAIKEKVLARHSGSPAIPIPALKNLRQEDDKLEAPLATP